MFELKPLHLYSKECLPSYLCPSCLKDYMHPIADSFWSAETAESVGARDDEDWEESFYTSRAYVRVACDSCVESGLIVFAGQLSHEDPAEGQEFYECFRPTFCYPAPRIFTLHESYPPEVRAALESAFNLAWSDKSAAAGRIRVAIERLLDSLGVQGIRTHSNGVARLSSKGRPIPIPLHERINDLGRNSGDRRICELLESVKWLGNAAAHDSEPVHEEALFHGFYVVEAVLANVYQKKSLDEVIEYYTKKINLFYHPEKETTWPTHPSA